LSPPEGDGFDLFENAGKEAPHGRAENELVSEQRLETRLSGVPFVAGHLGTVLSAQEKCHLVLRKTGAFAVCPEIVVEAFRHEGVTELPGGGFREPRLDH
jgi:hypothetical protein